MRIKHNMKAYKQLRKSPEVKELIEKHVEEILDELGEGYDGTVNEGKNRLRGAVWTKEWEAILENSRENTLLKALAQKAGGKE